MIFDDVLVVSLTDIRDVNDVPPENIMNNFDISKEWGFEDTEDEIQNEPIYQPNSNNFS